MESDRASFQSLPRIFTLQQIEKTTSDDSFLDDLISAIRDGFVASDSFFAAPIQTMGAPPAPPFQKCNDYSAQTCVKSGYFANQHYYVIKVASGGKPWGNSGLLQIYSQQTGKLEALLLDEGILTELRTAAVGALVAQFWAPRVVNRIGILGCGVQARYQLKLLARATSCRNVLVYGRNIKNVHTYVNEMTALGWSVAVAKAPNDLLESCDVVITTTSAREPLLTSLPVTKEPRLLICIGSDAPGKSEVASALLQAADLRVADKPEQSRERGEFQKCPELSVVALAEAINDKAIHRQENDRRFIVFDSSGLALQDCVIAQIVFQSMNRDIAPK